jgi:hypothetical protein
MPVGDVLVRDTRGHVEHDDTALAVDVVAITETTELLLTGGVPYIELDLAQVLLSYQLYILLPILDVPTVVKPSG